MKRFSRTFLLTIALLVIATTSNAQQKKAEKLYQQALYEMEGMGNYAKAIELFNQLVTQYPKEKPIAAKALLHLGSCYEKLGNTEAKRAYERIVRDFADQKQVVTEAKSRLVALGNAGNNKEKPAMTTRQVWTPEGSVHGAVSHDGRYLPYTDWDVPRGNGELFLHDIVSGANRRITHDVEKFGQEFAEEVTFSPDDTQLAYAWFNYDHYELRIIGLQATDASHPRVLFSNSEVSRIFPQDWSADGKWLAVQLQRRDKTAQIGLVAVQDGSLRILKSVDWRGSSKLFFSPDSKYLAYDLPSTDTGDQRDVFVLAIDGSREIPAVMHPSNDVLMGWSPDGRRLLFASARTGSTGLWALAFMDGKPQGAPEQIKDDVNGTSMGVTRKGTLYSTIGYSSFTGVIRSDIQVAAFDFAKGQFLSTPVSAVQTFVGANDFPAWSPDGKYLAFLSRREGTAIVILSHDTGQLRELRPQLKIYGGGSGVQWSPDGLSLAITATDSKGRHGIFRIDAATGEATPIAPDSRGPVGDGESFTDPMWAPDGKKIYYSRVSSAGNSAVIIERDFSSGNEKEVIRRSWNGFWLFVDLSPDGKYLAAVDNEAWPGHNIGKWNVLVIPTSGGEPKELMRGESLGAGILMWAPDSRSIFVDSIKGSILADSIKDRSTDDREVWRVAIDGTEPQKLGLNVNWLSPPFNGDQQFHVHPDGKRVAFAATEPARPREVWALENFLPALNKSK